MTIPFFLKFAISDNTITGSQNFKHSRSKAHSLSLAHNTHRDCNEFIL
uniref:Uncharacterized protein n=1 Tax=Human betaherpesvirus 6 TaxID=10368 RepID=A0A5P9U5D0_9BETA|nr:hypothetical protein [Human betaherpesvirus 6]